MARTEVYESILQELADGELEELEVKVFHFLRRVYPASLTRRDLVEFIFGYRPADEEDLNNNTDERKIRKAISSAYNKGVPIVSTSGGAGYRIDIDLEQWTKIAAELEAKKKTLSRKIKATFRIVGKIEKAGINAIPTHVPQTITMPAAAGDSHPYQLTFIGGES